MPQSAPPEFEEATADMERGSSSSSCNHFATESPGESDDDAASMVKHEQAVIFSSREKNRSSGGEETTRNQNYECDDSPQCPSSQSPPSCHGCRYLEEGVNADINLRKDPAPANNGNMEQPALPSNGGTSRPSSNKKRRTSSLIGEGRYHTEASGASKRSSSKRSSMELRRMPVNILLKPALQDTTSVLSDDPAGERKPDAVVERDIDVWRKTCLRPSFTLRTQMMLSFGTINVVTIGLVVAICVALTILVGDNVKSETEETLVSVAEVTQGLRARYLAESLSEKLMLADTVKLIYEAARDRFEGYPNPSDDAVPFLDVESGTNVYPVVGRPAPLEWDVNPNVNEGNYEEFLQSRWPLYKSRPVDTRNAGFILQGFCDPAETDPAAAAYWPNCTDANNDITTGGIVAPTSIAESIHRKGSDLVPLLRGLFEEREEIMDLGLYFANDGAGASINYPHYGLSSQESYTSEGCDWLLSPHPFNASRTIGTKAMISNCRNDGEKVSNRLYNPMERGWCRDQALNPRKVFAHSYENAWDPGQWLLSLGKAIYDRSTNEFVACIYVGISLSQVGDILVGSKFTNNTEATVVKWDVDGQIVSSSKQFAFVDGNTPIHSAGLGLNKDTYFDLFNLVDFESAWEPKEARDAYNNFSTRDENYYATAHPMPPVPSEYDSTYRPVFLVITSNYVNDLNEAVDEVSENIDIGVRNVNRFAVICGLAGITAAAIVIFVMARMLTSPLTQMNIVANEIVNNFGDPSKEAEIGKSDEDYSAISSCTPKTELSEVVFEFNKMVAGFSGSSEAKSEKYKDNDLENHFPARDELWKIYECRNDRLFKYNPTGESISERPRSRNGPEQEMESSDESSTSFPYLHFGPNHVASPGTHSNGGVTKKDPMGSRDRKRSPLALWIVALIVTPLIFITLLVSVGVIQAINAEFAQSTEELQTDFVELHKRMLLVYTSLRADYISSLTAKSTHDLHLLARYSSWLLFGALNRSNSFTEVTTGIEECKNYTSDYSKCDYYNDFFLCDCSWNERSFEDLCTNYNSSVRHRELLYWTAESSASIDGDRFETEFPDSSNSPQTTAWWDDATTVPGWGKGQSAAGHNATYDRLRVMSAVPMFQPLYHYSLGNGKEVIDAVNIAFEADGMFLGYGGCFSSRHVGLAEWQSTNENNAANLRPELCPVGKYGYDPRCRGWYHEGRKLAMSNESLLHVTSPYRFALSSVITYGQSATSAIMDPFTGEHVGQVIVDFLAQATYETVENRTYYSQGGFPILVAVQGDTADTIIGPGVSIDQETTSVTEGVLPYDIECSDESECNDRIQTFRKIVEAMKNGESASTTFSRKMENGELETVHMAYSPVYVPSIGPINSSDFSRGVERSDYQIYSFAIVEPEEGVLKGFQGIENSTKKQTNIAIVVITLVIVAAALIVVYFSHRLAKSFTEPMIYLLDLIRYINEHGVSQDPPPVRRVKASHEIVAFSRTLEALYMIVRSANIAFFAGETEVAYNSLLDALRLFRRLDNKKAVGIASNNIGNTLLAIYCEMQSDQLDELYGLKRDEVVKQGIARFHDAIHLGEKAYDEFYEAQGWSPHCLDFMQHLANRYFNRGMFLLRVKDDHENPKDIVELGMRDLQIASDMDSEVVSYGEDVGWGSKDKAEKRFNVNLVRIRGYNNLQALGYDHDWGVEELIEETLDIVKTEFRNRDSSELFATMTVAGRLQELEGRLMRHKVLNGDLTTAARIAVRMIIEDEHVFVDAMVQAIEVLILYAESELVSEEYRASILPALKGYDYVVERAVGERIQDARNDLDSMSNTKSGSFSLVRHTVTTRVSDSILPQEESSRFVTMEDF